MTDVEPVKAGTIVLRDATSVVPPSPWGARLASRRRMVVSGMRALTTGRLLPASALAVAAWAAARAAAGATAGRGRTILGPDGADAVARPLGPRAPGATFEVSWTHVEMRWRG